jgi:elongation factor G
MGGGPEGTERAAVRRLRAIRNLGVMAHIDAGKTTVSERLLFVAGRTHHLGEVHLGDTALDWMELERERGITISAAVTSLAWRGHDLHLVDTPGHVDFTIEVERSLRVLDGAVAVFDAAHGVEPQSETVWRQADRWRVPRLAFANKMDRVGADFEATLRSLRGRFPGQAFAPVQRPLGVADTFGGFEDLVAGQRVTFTDRDDPRAFTVEPGLGAEGAAARRALLGVLADHDDQAAEALLADRELDPAGLSAAIRRATLSGRFVPLLCGSALHNQGIPQLLDACCDWLPSPLDRPPPAATTPDGAPVILPPAGEDGPLLALAFKVSLLDERRRFVFLRIYAGTLSEGDEVWNASLGKAERVARVIQLHAAHKTRLASAAAGQIVAVLGLKEARTGDTLCDRARPVLLERIGGQPPVITQAIEPAAPGQREPLLEALNRVADEDPTFRAGEDPGTGQLVISGMGELHLEIVAERLKREFGLAVRTGRPQVLLRETLTREAEGAGVFEKTLDGAVVFAAAAVRVRPLARGEGLRFEVAPAAAAALSAHREALEFAEHGAREAAEAGALEGHPLQDVEVTLSEATWREGSSRPFAFKVAAAAAVREAAGRGQPVLLEPVARLEVVVPEPALGEALGAIDRRRGTILEVSDRGDGVKVIDGEAPLRGLFGFATELRSLTQGRALFTMRFDRFDVGR